MIGKVILEGLDDDVEQNDGDWKNATPSSCSQARDELCKADVESVGLGWEPAMENSPFWKEKKKTKLTWTFFFA